MITYMAAQEHVNDLIREADRYRLSSDARRPRRIAFTLPRVLTLRARRRGTA